VPFAGVFWYHVPGWTLSVLTRVLAVSESGVQVAAGGIVHILLGFVSV
jgi:hypothetical protein